ncbi:uncharacterized protein LOC119983596 [Tripterygium wilfordii]|uniref:uncharacterized protein LOC119983596 n=1 Tax=Tripterygium wilfordii TaxID=458696 RepID=UPI0018F8356D|nr:uncharacterized protein LOC119983596 [Tripterygium wilfordii]
MPYSTHYFHSHSSQHHHNTKHRNTHTLSMADAMKMKHARSGKTMMGFMCQSSSTAVCMAGGGNSVIVPLRRPSTILEAADNTRLLDNSGKYYTRVVHDSHHRLSSTTTTTLPINNKIRPPAVFVASLKKREQGVHSPRKAPKTTQIDPPPALPSSDNVFQPQVVVMRVSLHCQGCAGKVKKHLSKMEGVTSFSIDLENKRVTVMGHVSPIGVLESIKKVKKAEFWPS